MPTVIGGLVFVIGAWLLVVGSVGAMLAYVAMTTLMLGSAAVLLGGSSIPPAMIAMIFLAMRLMVPGARQMGNLRRAVASNGVLIIFAVYSVVASITLPFIFRRAVFVLPMKVDPKHFLDPVPLQFSMQNITTCLYTTATCVVAILVYMAVQQQSARRMLPMLTVVIIGIHCFFGIAGVVAGHTAFSVVIDFFRNASYAELDQEVGGIVRMDGICPEPSTFAAYGAVWFAFATELWLRDLRPQWTGPAAGLMGLVLLASTSSTSYVILAFYGMILVVRCAAFPSTITARKGLIVFGLGMAGVCAVLTLAFLKPTLVAEVGKVLASLTVNKADSSSGQTRLAEIKQGFTTFWSSYGLGVGPGSFRSSSLISAILGSMGVIGATTFGIYMLHVWKPLRRTTYASRTDPDIAIGAAASWTVVVATATAAITLPSSDPGILFAIFAGIALGARGAAAARQTAARTSDQRGRGRTLSPAAGAYRVSAPAELANPMLAARE